MRKRWLHVSVRFILFLGALALPLGWGTSASAQASRAAWGAKEGQACIQCHSGQNVALVEEWRLGAHGQQGVNCFDCHRAEQGDPDAFEHNGSLIHVVVTPKNCGRCHQREVDEQKGSHHAKAGQILASLDNFLGEVLGGPPAVATGCVQCHGSQIRVLPGGKLDPATWPNTGIGRINPDGSWGSCTACHTRHAFSVAQARRPEACGKCHLGPDHPQMEVYQESKHGILYQAFGDRLNIDRRKWIVGVDYTAAPTCSTCHMSASPTQGVTHDVGDRISWTLRPAISTKLNMVVYEDLWKDDVPDGAPLPKVGDSVKAKDGKTRKVTQVLTWQQRRQHMQEVCSQCHASGQVAGHYRQFDELVELYNDKFARPATAIMNELYKANKLTAAPMDEKLEWTYYELWHHEGRRGRHGASMSGPDYAWWHGIYDVAKNFYTQFIPEVKQAAGEPLAAQLLEKYVFNQPGHRWLKEGMTKEQLQKIQEFYRQRYGE
ncbi:MAG TPA: multiheme c-type cytochrome [Candidatus Methylomirabilis sp.]|nr:multiheme c-type cytochrome [Candidatus Methylomirabilis sp.]